MKTNASTERNYLEFVDMRAFPVPYMPKWWDRPRWWLVRLLGGECPLDTVKVTRIPVNGKDFMTRLWKQKRALVESFHREGTTLWMGAEDYEELMNSPTIWQAFTIHASYNHGERAVCGLTVKVIPWMRGTLVMP